MCKTFRKINLKWKSRTVYQEHVCGGQERGAEEEKITGDLVQRFRIQKIKNAAGDGSDCPL